VIAGKRINVGEQINILYGGGVLNNDRILQDYGFYVADNVLDVKQLISPKTKEPLVGYPFPGMGKTLEDLKQVATANFLCLETFFSSVNCCKFGHQMCQKYPISDL